MQKCNIDRWIAVSTVGRSASRASHVSLIGTNTRVPKTRIPECSPAITVSRHRLTSRSVMSTR